MKPYINPGEKIMEELARKGKVDIIYPKGYDDYLTMDDIELEDRIVQSMIDKRRGK